MCVWKHTTLPDTALADCYQYLEYCKKAQEQTLNNPLITAMYVHAEVRKDVMGHIYKLYFVFSVLMV